MQKDGSTPRPLYICRVSSVVEHSHGKRKVVSSILTLGSRFWIDKQFQNQYNNYMKQCSDCKQTLPLTAFNRKGEGYQSKCRECNKAYYKNYYQTVPKEKARIVAKNKSIRIQVRDFVREQKSTPCTDCNESHPYYVMQFDHTGTDKEFNISRAVGESASLSKIKAEIAKCEVVCANCHAYRTHARKTE